MFIRSKNLLVDPHLSILDLCASQPCQNGGQCSVVNNAVSCRCINGYTGVFCQIAPRKLSSDIHIYTMKIFLSENLVPCASTPCQNGGQCGLLSPNVFGCVCPPEFTGTQCETSILGEGLSVQSDWMIVESHVCEYWFQQTIHVSHNRQLCVWMEEHVQWMVLDTFVDVLLVGQVSIVKLVIVSRV